MARKHNVKHERSPSHYKARLQARGLSRTPRMKSLQELCTDKTHDHRNHVGAGK